MPIANVVQQTDEYDQEVKVEKDYVPHEGTVDYLYYWSQFEGKLPTPIDVSITGSIRYTCPELKWYNFDVYPHKIKVTNTGYTVVLGAKWKTERPYLEGGCFRERHVMSQVHFHWGPDLTMGSDHTVDKRRYPGEMQVTYFKAEYMTQQQAMLHDDGVVIVCYIIKYGVNPDIRITRILEGFPRIQEAQTYTHIGPYPLSQLMPLFYEDYFLYWGGLKTVRGDNHTVRWLIPRVPLYASFEQMKEFRKLWNPWDEPNLGNSRPLQERGDRHGTPIYNNQRHVWFINPHWAQYNSTLPIPRVIEESISVLSPEYLAKPWMLPKQNAYMLPKPEEEVKNETVVVEEDIQL